MGVDNDAVVDGQLCLSSEFRVGQHADAIDHQIRRQDFAAGQLHAAHLAAIAVDCGEALAIVDSHTPPGVGVIEYLGRDRREGSGHWPRAQLQHVHRDAACGCDGRELQADEARANDHCALRAAQAL